MLLKRLVSKALKAILLELFKMSLKPDGSLFIPGKSKWELSGDFIGYLQGVFCQMWQILSDVSFVQDFFYLSEDD